LLFLNVNFQINKLSLEQKYCELDDNLVPFVITISFITRICPTGYDSPSLRFCL